MTSEEPPTEESKLMKEKLIAEITRLRSPVYQSSHGRGRISTTHEEFLENLELEASSKGIKL